mgnify:CR=1 FL=1
MINENDMYHVGVLGMKWGHRKSKTISVPSTDHVESRALKKKKVHELSNAEIAKINTRLQLEKNLRDLDKKEVSKGRKMIEDVLSNQARATLTVMAAGAVALATPHIKTFVKYAIGKAKDRIKNG